MHRMQINALGEYFDDLEEEWMLVERVLFTTQEMHHDWCLKEVFYRFLKESTVNGQREEQYDTHVIVMPRRDDGWWPR